MISVLLPVHRSGIYLADAIQSIVNQSFSDFEILFLDNSEHGLSEEEWNLSEKIRHIRLPREYGISEALNAGIIESSSKYVARMDSDDISKQNRFELQVSYMESHPNISILGGGIEVIGADLDANVRVGDTVLRSIESAKMQEYLLYKNPIFHPTVIIKREDLIKNNLFYNKKYDAAEDLDLWMRASHKVLIANLDQVVLNYRIHPSQYSREAGINSQFLAAKLRIRHSMWMIFFRPLSSIQAFKVLLKNFQTLAILGRAYKNRPTFNKFG
jgi:glycosyltransferase involved in cell wall biosynthesis